MNKTLTVLTMALVLGFSGVANARHDDYYGKHRGGFMEGEAQVSTVQEALNMEDDSMVSLKGKIQKRLKKDKYMFQDNTGSIVVEIDKDVWRGQNVTPSDTIVISGDVERDDDRTMVDVKRLMMK